MESLLLSFNVIAPLFFCMALGYGLKRGGVFKEAMVSQLNSLVFSVFLPIMVFENVYKTDLANSFDVKLLVFALASIIVIFGVLCLIIPAIERDNARRGVLIQGIFRSNFVIFGIPVTAAIFGSENTGMTVLLVAVVVPVFNTLSVVALELFRGKRVNVPQLIKNVLLNPLIIASASGILLLVLGVKLPSAIESTVSSLSGVTTPLALLVLGGYFDFSAVRKNLKPLIIGVSGRLVAVSIIFMPIAALIMGFRGPALVALLILFAAPTSVSSFTMARQMGADGELAGQLVIFSSALSIVTIFVWIFVCRCIGWI